MRKVTALGSFFPGGVWLFYGVSPATLSPKKTRVSCRSGSARLVSSLHSAPRCSEWRQSFWFQVVSPHPSSAVLVRRRRQLRIRVGARHRGASRDWLVVTRLRLSLWRGLQAGARKPAAWSCAVSHGLPPSGRCLSRQLAAPRGVPDVAVPQCKRHGHAWPAKGCFKRVFLSVASGPYLHSLQSLV